MANSCGMREIRCKGRPYGKLSWAEGDRGHGRLYDKISLADGGKGPSQVVTTMARSQGPMVNRGHGRPKSNV